MTPARIAIVGAPSLLAKELANALDERRFPCLPPRLLGADAAAGDVRLAALDDEAAVVEPLTSDALRDADLVFMTVPGARALVGQVARLVDLTGESGTLPEAAVVGWGAGNNPGSRVCAIAHPAAQMLAVLVERLAQLGQLEATAVIFEPASERGLAGILELEQQSRSLLALQSLPQAVFGTQVAFNLRAQLGAETAPSLRSVRERITTDLAALATTHAAAIEVFQAPVFHATGLALHARFKTSPPLDAVRTALADARISMTATADALSAAGQDAIQLGSLRLEGDGVWLFATLDNLRRTAHAAVDAGFALLGGASA